MQRKKNSFNRRDFLTAIGGGAVVLALNSFGKAQSTKNINQKEMLVYVGTYTSGKSKSEGIYIHKLNLASGELKPYKIVKNVVEPSYLAIDNERRYLYAVNETEKFEGKNSGAVSSFAINQKTGDLEFLNKQPSLGGAPCYVSVSRDRKFVLAANYVGGNVCVLPTDSGGKLETSSDLARHFGSSINKDRQESAHAHSIIFDEKNKFAFSCDLGADKIYIYNFDKQTGKLTANPAQPFFQIKAGAGPRHIVLSENQENAYIINELHSTISAFAFDKKKGILREIQTVSTLPAGYDGANNTGADIHLAPSGKFLYGSNRGHDSIAVYRIDEKNGRLEYVENTSVEGKKPRNFAVDPTGNFLLVANQDSNTITTFKIDGQTGKLKFTGQKTEVPTPVCLKLIPGFST